MAACARLSANRSSFHGKPNSQGPRTSPACCFLSDVHLRFSPSFGLTWNLLSFATLVKRDCNRHHGLSCHALGPVAKSRRKSLFFCLGVRPCSDPPRVLPREVSLRGDRRCLISHHRAEPRCWDADAGVNHRLALPARTTMHVLLAILRAEEPFYYRILLSCLLALLVTTVFVSRSSHLAHQLTPQGRSKTASSCRCLRLLTELSQLAWLRLCLNRVINSSLLAVYIILDAAPV